MTEPRLTDDDRRAWETFRMTALAHAGRRIHRDRVERARRIIEDALHQHPNACVMWSGGKDSTALTHLVCVELGARLPVYSEKDDLDYPGEEDYVRDLASQWGADLRVIRPPFSLREWMREHAPELRADEDMHSRSAELSKAAFYSLVEEATATHDLVFLGLRAEESRGRAMNRATRGTMYRKQNGQVVCQPLADWRGLDVYAYLFARGIDVLPVYRCIGLMHADEPWRVRKSWWIPGAATRHGGIVWLRRYWPSLYADLCRMLPDASLHG